MAQLPKILWLFVPPFLLLAGWTNDNLIPLLFAKSYNITRQFGIYDFWSKWLFGGAAACIMVNWRFRFSASPSKAWLCAWLTLWLMLLFEVSARFFGLFGWMGGSLRFRLFPRCHDCPATEHLMGLLNWATRPMFAFGVIFVAYSLVRRSFKPIKPR